MIYFKVKCLQDFVVWLCYAQRGQALVLAAMSALLLLMLAAAPPRPAPRAPAPAPRAAPADTAPPQPPQPPAPRPCPRPLPLLTRALYAPGFARAHAELCPARGARLRLLILVASAPAHAAQRRAVRLTWGHAAQRRDVALAFVLGAPPPGQPALRAALAREDAVYGDLIEGRSTDCYSNLTLKSVSMLEWKATYCPRAPFLLKADDDVFVNVGRLLRFAAAPARARARCAVWGALASRVRPARAPLHKNFAPLDQFPGAVFPDFVRGPAYLVSARAAGRLARAAGAARFLRLEDVFVTGVVAAARGVRRVRARGFLRLRAPRHPCEARRWVAVHLARPRDQLALWSQSLDGQIKCRVPPPV